MLVKILGSIDIISSLTLLFLISAESNYKILLFFGIILIIKSSFGMLRDFASWVDFLCGAIFLLSIILNIPSFIIIILSLLLFQKGVFSWI